MTKTKLMSWGMALLALVLLVALGAPQADPLDKTSGVQLLQRFMKKIRTVDTTFTQEVVGEDGRLSSTAVGRFQLLRPGRFRWDYERPNPQEIVADGKSVWVYDKELDQVTVKPLKEALGGSPAAILMKDRDLSREFTITERKPREGLKWVELTPRRPDSGFQRILVGLDADGIQAMDLYDPFGRLTMIRFHDPRFNVGLPASRFRFTPPPGADVIGTPG